MSALILILSLLTNGGLPGLGNDAVVAKLCDKILLTRYASYIHYICIYYMVLLVPRVI